MEVIGWHLVGFSVAMEREAIGPAQDNPLHGSTEQLMADPVTNRDDAPGPDGGHGTAERADPSGFPTDGGTCGP